MIKRDRPYFYAAIALFVIGAVSGMGLYVSDPVQSSAIFEQVKTSFKKLSGLHPLMLMLFIFLNNFIKGIVAMFLGIIIFIPSLFIFFNGVVLGLFQMYYEANHLSTMKLYLSLAPHGIIELPAIFMATGLGLKLGMIPWKRVTPDERRTMYRDFFKDSRKYIIFIFGMLLVAAIVEVTVTPYIIHLFKK